MSELSVFVDESGDFGEYSSHSPYYIITMIFHNQDKNIQPLIEKLEYELSNAGFNDQCIHVGPIIRKEESFTYMNIEERKSIFNKMFAFIRSADIQYKCFMKFSSKSFSKSEMLFFNNYREFKKNYLKILKVKEYK